MATTSTPLVSVTGLSHLVVRVVDLERSLAFYQRILGAQVYADHREAGKKGGSAQVIVGAMMIEFIESAPEASAAAPRRERDWPGFSTLAFTTADVSGALEKLKAEGLTKFPEPMVMPSGVKIILFRDPDGNVLELVENPGETMYETAVAALARK